MNYMQVSSNKHLLLSLIFVMVFLAGVSFGQQSKAVIKIEITVKDGVFSISGNVNDETAKYYVIETSERILGQKISGDKLFTDENLSLPRNIWLPMYEADLIKIKGWKSGLYIFSPVTDDTWKKKIIEELHALKVKQLGKTESVKLIDPDKKATLLFLFATWCGPCREQLPYIEQINKDYKSKGLDVVIVFVDELENELPKLRDALESGNDSKKVSDSFSEHMLDLMKNKMRGVEMPDEESDKLIIVSNFAGIPQTFLLSDQKLIHIARGAAPEEIRLLQQAVEDLFNSSK